MNRKKLIFSLLSLCVFLGCVLSINFLPAGIDKSLNNYTISDDGVKIFYDLFVPKDDTSLNKAGIIIGHGVMVNKQFLRSIAMDLSTQGFVVAALDFRGHGRSGGSLEMGNITTDILAIKNVFALRGDINMSNLGYLGYSMGGGAGFQLLSSDTDFKAMVSLASSGTSEYNPPNLLILQGKFDEVVRLDRILSYMENRTGVLAEDIEPNQIYGSFENGTALKLVISNVDHLLAPYSRNNIREARYWFLKALKSEDNPPTDLTNYNIMVILVILATFSGIILFLYVSEFVVKKFSIRKPSSDSLKDSEVEIDRQSLRKKVIKGYWFIAIPLSIPCIIFGAPLIFLPLYFMSLIVILLLGPAIAGVFYLWYLLKKQGISFGRFLKIEFKKSSLRNIVIGIGLGLVLYGILALSIGYIFGIVPGITKWGWAVFYAVFMFIIQFMLAIFYRTIFGPPNPTYFGRMKEVGLISIMNFTPIAIVVLLSTVVFQSLFNLQFLIPIFPLIFLINIVSMKIHSENPDFIMSSLINGIMLTIFAVTLAYR